MKTGQEIQEQDPFKTVEELTEQYQSTIESQRKEVSDSVEKTSENLATSQEGREDLAEKLIEIQPPSTELANRLIKGIGRIK